MARYDRSAFMFEGHVRETSVIGPEWATTECRVHVRFNERNIITHLTRALASGPSLGKRQRRGGANRRVGDALGEAEKIVNRLVA